jgi:hypothetical protein
VSGAANQATHSACDGRVSRGEKSSVTLRTISQNIWDASIAVLRAHADALQCLHEHFSPRQPITKRGVLRDVRRDFPQDGNRERSHSGHLLAGETAEHFLESQQNKGFDAVALRSPRHYRHWQSCREERGRVAICVEID